MEKVRYFFLIGTIFTLLLFGYYEEGFCYFSNSEKAVVHINDFNNKPTINTSGWKTFKNGVFQFNYPANFELSGCNVREGYSFFCDILEEKDLASVIYEPVENYDLELERDIEKSILVRYKFEGAPCGRGGEIYRSRNFVNSSGLECKELKVKEVMECYSLDGSKVEKIREYYDKPSIYLVKLKKGKKKAYFYLVPSWGKKMIANNVLRQIAQSIQVN
jgi:hypothetical protein